jgi:hypothetical protein
MALSCIENGRYVVLMNQAGKGEKVFIIVFYTLNFAC